eukprot:snap_masked-scaffold_19-processed-gene-5.0-mRNA-1 protein AED:1.00 eAED:1.00 QI:0/0/0/0/1/1/2/0/65
MNKKTFFYSSSSYSLRAHISQAQIKTQPRQCKSLKREFHPLHKQKQDIVDNYQVFKVSKPREPPY